VTALIPHPTTRTDAWTVAAVANRSAEGKLHLRYVLRGSLDTIRLPPPGDLRRDDRLWEHTCAEAFVATESAPGYVELNVSPSRAWAAYAFTAYREPAPLAPRHLEPRIVVEREHDVLTLDVHVDLAELSPAYPDAVLDIGLTTVIEGADGGISYWALRHPCTQPDFHHRDGFVLRLAPPHHADADANGSST
jgi:hypothetical protein